MKRLKKIPKFKDEKAEAAFWSANDSAEYLDWNKARRVTFPNLKPSTKSIALRLPEGLLYAVKAEAHKMDMPYQSLIKLYVAEKVRENATR